MFSNDQVLLCSRTPGALKAMSHCKAARLWFFVFYPMHIKSYTKIFIQTKHPVNYTQAVTFVFHIPPHTYTAFTSEIHSSGFYGPSDAGSTRFEHGVQSGLRRAEVRRYLHTQNTWPFVEHSQYRQWKQEGKT